MITDEIKSILTSKQVKRAGNFMAILVVIGVGAYLTEKYWSLVNLRQQIKINKIKLSNAEKFTIDD